MQNESRQGKLHRYQSWNIIFDDFNNSKDADFLARSLTIYLASWGMMRGSSKLLKVYNYKVHIDLMKELLQNDLDGLRKYPKNEKMLQDYIQRSIQIKEIVKRYYTSYEDDKGEKTPPSDTLISKILLGVTGSMPAFDRNFKIFLREKGIEQTISEKSLTEIWRMYFDNKRNLKKYERSYPPMKLIDMAGFQYGKPND